MSNGHKYLYIKLKVWLYSASGDLISDRNGLWFYFHPHCQATCSVWCSVSDTELYTIKLSILDSS